MSSSRTKIKIIADTRELLVERFPAAFMPKGAQKLPLKVGIFDDLCLAAPDVDVRHLRWAINDYCAGPKYLRNLINGATRINLLGNEAGFVNEEAAAVAERCLLRLNAPKHMKSENDKLWRRVAEAETALRIWDDGRNSEYWLRHEPLKALSSA
jgi:sRNA-binding protein